MRDIDKEIAALQGKLSELTEKSPLAEALVRYRDDPVAFVEEVLFRDTDYIMYQWQKDVMFDFAADDTRRLAVRSGHGVGKTAMLAWLTIWLMLTRFPIKIRMTAPTSGQLGSGLWAEIGKWYRRLPDVIKDEYEYNTSALFAKKARTESFCEPRTSSVDKPEALAGLHEEHVVFIIDEASGVPDIVYQVGRSALSTPGAKQILTGNPTRLQGYFYDAFHKNRDRWKLHHVKSTDVPATQVDTAFVKETAKDYGIDSNVYRIQVLGEFPSQDFDAIIPKELIESAVNRIVEGTKSPVVWGVDIARQGADRSALAKRKGNILLEPIKHWQKPDLMQTVGIIVDEYNNTPDFLKPSHICVDVIGLGAGVVDRLRELSIGEVNIVGVNVAEAAAVKDRYNRLRDELWFRTKEWFTARSCKINADQAFIDELSNVTYTILSNGKFKAEGKDEMKRRGQRSPDLSDAFVLTMYIQTEGQYTSFWNKEMTYDYADIL